MNIFKRYRMRKAALKARENSITAAIINMAWQHGRTHGLLEAERELSKPVQAVDSERQAKADRCGSTEGPKSSHPLAHILEHELRNPGAKYQYTYVSNSSVLLSEPCSIAQVLGLPHYHWHPEKEQVKPKRTVIAYQWAYQQYKYAPWNITKAHYLEGDSPEGDCYQTMRLDFTAKEIEIDNRN
jgi:hypothetical protein